MTSAVFGGMPLLLLAASFYWAFRHPRGQRPAGTLSMAALMACFAVAFSAYQPSIRAFEDSVALDFSRLVSNGATLAAAASVSSLLLFLNHPAEDARRLMRRRHQLLALAIATMAVCFAVTPSALVWSATELRGNLGEAPTALHVYSVAYIAYLAYAVLDCLMQTWTRSRTATRASQRFGLRVTALGCLFALAYTTYKSVNAVATAFGWEGIPRGPRCISLITPISCAFSVTAPAIGVLLITIGLTLPAILWPVTQYRRRRWERQSIADLEPLWRDLTAVLPEIVLETDAESEDEADFLLHRRIVEINDGILTLRAFRSRVVQHAAAREVTRRQLGRRTDRDAVVEAAVLVAAVNAMRAGAVPETEPAPEAPGTSVRAGDLHAEATWLRSVARAYAGSATVRTATQDTRTLETAEGRA